MQSQHVELEHGITMYNLSMLDMSTTSPCRIPTCSQPAHHAQVLAALRLELFRTLLLQKVEFFDRHNTTELTSLLSVELDTVRSFVFGNVSRDRGLRAILEASGSVLVLFVLSWRLGPVLGLVIISTAVTAALYRQQTKEVEQRNSKALSHMVGVADQAFAAIRTVR